MDQTSTYSPLVMQETSDGLRLYDIRDEMLAAREIEITGAIDAGSVSNAIRCLLHLQKEDQQSPITLYINSPGGSVSAGMGIYDTMKFIRPKVCTICVGLAASMGALLLSSGEKGRRYALPHSRVMIHQPLGGIQGQATEIEITARQILRTKQELNQILADNCGKPVSEVSLDTERDYWLVGEEAMNYGLVDRIFTTRAELEKAL